MDMEYYLCIFTFCFTLLWSRKSSDDDSIDRLNRKYTVYGLIALAVLSDRHLATTKVSSLISCWNRANFPPAYVKYTENICFITHTYRLAVNETIPEATRHRLLSDRERMVNNKHVLIVLCVCLGSIACWITTSGLRSLSCSWPCSSICHVYFGERWVSVQASTFSISSKRPAKHERWKISMIEANWSNTSSTRLICTWTMPVDKPMRRNGKRRCSENSSN